MKRTELIALIESIIAITLWGVSFLFIKVALREVSATTLIVVRFGMGLLVLGAIAWKRGDFASLRLTDVPGIALLGVVGITLQQLLQVSGQVTADASVAAFLAAMAPAFTVLLAALLLREQLRAWQVLGLLLASGGALLVSTNGDLGSLLRGSLGTPGNGLILLSSVAWAALTILNRRVVADRPPVLVTAGMFFFGLLFTLPFFFAQQGWRELGQVSALGWGCLLAIGLICTAAAYLLNSHALKHISASRVAVIQNIEPISAVVGAALFLDEAVTGTMLLGGAAIMIGVVLSERAASVVSDLSPAPSLKEANGDQPLH
ncbi:DMT family transporter [Sorangium sp. So ce375]|uniref:DMT family transporter n=1 Tax=Sorangium sp. So ce375 TaxID=3133306 RepID=UPI003F5BF2E3